MIRLQEVLNKMQAVDKNGQLLPFSVVVITADRARKTGGEILEIESAVLARLDKSDKDSYNQLSKKYSSINIKISDTDQIRAIHPRLITRFNGEGVIY